MALSVFDLFKIGIGPSSSHTVGPMIAADRFARGLAQDGLLDSTERVTVELFGSLGATGKGHGSIPALALGLMGERPDAVDPERTPERIATITETGLLPLLNEHPIKFNLADDIVLHRTKKARFHSNAMVFRAFDDRGTVLAERTFYSIGGGFVLDDTQVSSGDDPVVIADPTPVRYPFRNGDELLAHAAKTGLKVSDIVMANEMTWHTEEHVRTGLLRIWSVMQECIQAGIKAKGVLPGGLKVRRRAPQLAAKLAAATDSNDPLIAMDRVTLYAIAVNEENAAGGRVVTAPTNGAAGIIPAVLHYYHDYIPGADDDGTVRFLLVAAGDRHPSSRRTPRSAAPRWVARARSARRARWRRRADRTARRNPLAGGERRGNRYRAQPGADLRPGRGAGPDPVHRTQRRRRGEGHHRRADRAQRRRNTSGVVGQGRQDHARNRCGHEGQVQGNRARRLGAQRR